MDFPSALARVLKGQRIANSNWKGSGAYLFAMPGYESVQANEVLAKAAKINVGKKVCIAPYLMRCSQSGIFVPYSVTNIDIFSEDWYIWGI